ncbi:MAG: DUF4197 domain-containing protein [Deltaproteobacteria bacterium]|nr:DUF4197 domain-containing protein [Deltaproteobacteria bacterium]
MKKFFVIFLFFSFILSSPTRALDWDKLGKEISKTGQTLEDTLILGKKPLTQKEVIQGLKQALSIGSQKAGQKASQENGFYKNRLIFIPFPPEAKKVKQTALQLGMKRQVDNFVLTLNRAAEEAAKEAAPIFLKAISSMSIQDGFKILNGPDTAATNYLQQKTTAQLKKKFRPIVKKAIKEVQVTRYWNPILTRYNQLPMVKKQNPNLDEYVLQRSLEGLFYLVGQEEKGIRKNPAARVTDLLKRVFGSVE